MTVKATREGLEGQRTATGWIINDKVPFVALPTKAALWAWVIVKRESFSIRARVLDIGPHYIDDDAYVFAGARPKAESDESNGAGIDLGQAVWNALAMTDNGVVSWEFD